MTDEQAMWRVQRQDDGQAFAELVKRWERPIQRLAMRLMGDRQRGEDLAQETFARLFARRKQYECRGRFSTFLWRMALNLCYDELRRRQRLPEIDLESVPESTLDFAEATLSPQPVAPDAHALQTEESAQVRQALGELPELYRTILVLRHYENLKFREIAEVLEIPEGTVKSRMAEALTRLGRRLQPLCEPEKPPYEKYK